MKVFEQGALFWVVRTIGASKTSQAFRIFGKDDPLVILRDLKSLGPDLLSFVEQVSVKVFIAKNSAVGIQPVFRMQCCDCIGVREICFSKVQGIPTISVGVLSRAAARSRSLNPSLKLQPQRVNYKANPQSHIVHSRWQQSDDIAVRS